MRTQEEIKQDVYDKKLLFYLSQNFRYPRKQLAKELKLPLYKLHYKINRLKEELIRPTVLLNYPLLGIKSHILFFKSPTTKAHKLHSNSHVYFLIQLVGTYQYIALVIAKNILTFCEQHLPDEDIDIYTLDEYHPDNHNPHNFPSLETPKHPYKYLLDVHDYKVLKEIVLDPEISMLELSNKAKMHRTTATQRLKKLIESDTIQRIRYELITDKYSFLVYILEIKASPGSIRKILNHITTYKHSGFAYLSNNVIINYQFPPDNKELVRFVKELYSMDPTMHVEIMQSNGEYYISSTPKVVLQALEEKINSR